jgi:hypothetical protein
MLQQAADQRRRPEQNCGASYCVDWDEKIEKAVNSCEVSPGKQIAVPEKS